MKTGRSTVSRHRSTMALASLAASTFVIGTTELMIVGILRFMAKDVAVTIDDAGWLVTGYALGIAVGAPILSAVLARFDRLRVLRLAFVAFLLGNIGIAVCASFVGLAVLRVCTGALHGLIAGLATSLAAGLVSSDRRGRAISIVVGGITVSTVVGVPVGTVVASSLGWRAAFAAVVVVGGACLCALFLVVSSPVASSSEERDERSFKSTGDERRRSRRQLGATLSATVIFLLAISVALYAGQFTLFTFLASFLTEEAAVPASHISVYLLLFGFAATLGTFLGGKAADWNAPMTMVVANSALVAALFVLYIAGENRGVVVVSLIVWGIAGFAIPPALLLRLTTVAVSGKDQAATFGISASNGGIALGSVVGGWVIATYGAHILPLVAFLVCLLCLPATVAARWLTQTSRSVGNSCVATHSCGTVLGYDLSKQHADTPVEQMLESRS